jgi:phenylalanyl-tRNA synthetase beta chain
MNAAPLFAALAPAPRCRPIPPSAAVRRDIAVVAAEATPAQRLLDRLGEALPGGAVESVALFDLFTGPPIPPGRKGLAFSVRLRLPEEGGEAGIDAAVERLRAALREEGCEIR